MGPPHLFYPERVRFFRLKDIQLELGKILTVLRFKVVVFEL
jgi:hypothetical protein